MKKTSLALKIVGVSYLLVLGLYALFSYSLTDPNLVLTSWSPYWQFQQWLWQTFFTNAPLLTYTFIGLITILSLIYTQLLISINQATSLPLLTLKKVLIVIFLFSLPLLVSYNALSHDVFNYIFNAKMVVVYHANPHHQTALDFAHDQWTRFMHNTHTPAPYGYGWTAVSLIPFGLGWQKFLPTWLLFRAFSWLSLLLTTLSIWWVVKHTGRAPLSWAKIAIGLLSPLLLIEIISNSHNDLWMMAPAILSLGLMAVPKRNKRHVAMAVGLLLFSVSIKWASLVILPVWLGLGILVYLPQQLKSMLQRYWPLLASLLLFMPLLTARSQQFHPWYLVWVLVWLPLFGPVKETIANHWLNWLERTWTSCVIVLSISSLFRYVPWLWAGGFSETVVAQQKLITWLPMVLAAGWLVVLRWKKHQ